MASWNFHWVYYFFAAIITNSTNTVFFVFVLLLLQVKKNWPCTSLTRYSLLVFIDNSVILPIKRMGNSNRIFWNFTHNHTSICNVVAKGNLCLFFCLFRKKTNLVPQLPGSISLHNSSRTSHLTERTQFSINRRT